MSESTKRRHFDSTASDASLRAATCLRHKYEYRNPTGTRHVPATESQDSERNHDRHVSTFHRSAQGPKPTNMHRTFRMKTSFGTTVPVHAYNCEGNSRSTQSNPSSGYCFASWRLHSRISRANLAVAISPGRRRSV